MVCALCLALIQLCDSLELPRVIPRDRIPTREVGAGPLAIDRLGYRAREPNILTGSPHPAAAGMAAKLSLSTGRAPIPVMQIKGFSLFTILLSGRLNDRDKVRHEPIAIL
ncbi:MAG: hypothetical protein JWQ22_1399, partial [Devosia sp.]|nr:hypothetical protein [Devosia sp.]